MAKTTKDKYNSFELEQLERKLEELLGYIDSNPLNELEDRYGRKISGDNVTTYVVATIEAQRKDITAAIKEYAEISRIIGDMREEKERKIESRGGAKVSVLANDFLKDK